VAQWIEHRTAVQFLAPPTKAKSCNLATSAAAVPGSGSFQAGGLGGAGLVVIPGDLAITLTDHTSVCAIPGLLY
jgi:hypothetical protein